ncbi:MAG: ABC transporter permease [Anaerolineales bacterium]|nr:ABC transporter permease [Anaerolineales bacterium]
METKKRLSLLIMPSVLVLAVLFVLPMLIMALYSFRAGSFGEQQATFTLQHYQTLFDNNAFQRLMLRSILISFWVSVYTVLLAYPIAYYLVFQAGARRMFLLTLIIAPAWVSYLLRVLSWKVILGSSGMLASFLSWIGLPMTGSSFLLYSQPAVTITLVYVWIPFVALPIFAALERIDASLLEAARDLGCSRWQAFLRVTLPLSLPGVVAGFLFVFIPTVGEYVTPALVGGTEGIMIGNIIQDQFLRALNWPMGALLSLEMLVLILIPLIIFSRIFRFNELAGI